jgi:hypothetical protein
MDRIEKWFFVKWGKDKTPPESMYDFIRLMEVFCLSYKDKDSLSRGDKWKAAHKTLKSSSCFLHDSSYLRIFAGIIHLFFKRHENDAFPI